MALATGYAPQYLTSGGLMGSQISPIAAQNTAQPMPMQQPALPITNNTAIAPAGAAPVMAPTTQQYGLGGAEAALNAGQVGATQAVTAGANGAATALNSIGGLTGQLDQFGTAGVNAQNQMAGLTGTGTPEQNAAAMNSYKASSGYNYVLDQTLRGTERSAAARGGLLGGNVALELQKNAMGLASTDYQNQFNNLNTVASNGLNAATNSLGVKADAKNRLAELSQSTGLNLGGLISGTAEQKAGYRYQAGQDIAANATTAASNIGKLLQDQGIQLSDAMNKDISSITDMIYQSGMQDKIDNQNLAALLANINGGQATNILQSQTSIGAAQQQGAIDMNNALQGGITNAFSSGLIKKV